MLIQSHSLLAKLLGKKLCQKTVSLGATAWPRVAGSEGVRERQPGEGPETTCRPPALGGVGKCGEPGLLWGGGGAGAGTGFLTPLSGGHWGT